MYFSHENSNGVEYYIEAATLDGANRQLILNSTTQIGSLTIDYDMNRLYFVHTRVGAIEYLDLKNNGVSEIVYFLCLNRILIGFHYKKKITNLSCMCMQFHEVLSSDGKIEGITVYKNEIYFAETTDSKIERCDKDNCANRITVRSNKGIDMKSIEFV